VRIASNDQTSFRRVMRRPENESPTKLARLVVALLREVLGARDGAEVALSSDL